ncbi:ATP-binding protein, partial [Streptomyces cellulosae]
MRISRLTVDKLGIKLYDRVSAVLAEIIANAYDADATEVKVRLPFGTWLASPAGKPVADQYEISVEDNGHGMTADEVNTHYL